ncbi:MAG: ABC transporter C-terminal domain-containing protein, partial [Tumebacillaceae bacterium]
NPKEKAATEAKAAANKPRKMSYQEQKEFDTIDERIAGLETKIEAVQAELAKGGTDYTHLQKLQAEQERLESELEQAVERWAELNELAEEIARNKGK